jgi:hypothetical protein
MAYLSTYGDVVDMFYDLIKDSATSQRLATTDQVDVWANAAMSELAEHAEYIDYVVDTVETGTIITGIASISVGSTEGDLMGLWRVEIDDDAIYPTTTRELYKSSRTWQAQTGEPRWYYLDSMRDDDDITVGLWPKPSSNYGLRMIFTTTGDDLDYANKDERVMLPLWAVPGLLWGIMHRFYESESHMQNLKAGQFYKLVYNDFVERVKARSYSRLNRFKAYGEGRGRKVSGDIRNLVPADGFPYP